MIVAALLHVAPPASRTLPPSPQTPRTVQISLDVEADVLITTSAGKRIGKDRTTHKFVNELSDAQMIENESSSTFVLPYQPSGERYSVALSGKASTATVANLSMTGPGFVVGVRNLTLKIDEVQKVDLSPDGTSISLEPGHDGPTPQFFLAIQADRSKASYRFEVTNSFLSRGKSMRVELESSKGWLKLGANEPKKSSFSINMRRTNPGGSRDVYTQHDVSFGRDNGYTMDFGKWDGRGEIRFCQAVGVDSAPCTSLKNEALLPKPN
jgi:hypothetical protein